MSKLTELESRVANRKQELIDEIKEHKMSSRHGAPAAIERLKSQLSELAHIVKNGMAGERAQVDLTAWAAR